MLIWIFPNQPQSNDIKKHSCMYKLYIMNVKGKTMRSQRQSGQNFHLTEYATTHRKKPTLYTFNAEK